MPAHRNRERELIRMCDTAADFLCERLIAWRVRTIYGFPGDGINGILGALRRHQDRLRFVQTRHEEMAAFMARARSICNGRFAADRPVIIDAMSDLEEPPIPPPVTFEQMKAMTSSSTGNPSAGFAGLVSAARESAQSSYRAGRR